MCLFLRAMAAGLVLVSAVGCRAAAPVEGYTVVRRLPHSTENFTEGFFYLDGHFWEGTGLERHSEVLEEEVETGRVVKSVDLPPQIFGEGIVNWGSYLYEWTWRTGVLFVRDRATLKVVRTMQYDGEGWGMTRNDKEIVTSNGSSELSFRDPATFKVKRTVTVHDGPTVVEQLNELEWVRGEIYANVWHSERIARVSPDDGHVIAWIDLTGILPESERVNEESVLNGIAYDAARDRLWVTGKQWPVVFEIKVKR